MLYRVHPFKLSMTGDPRELEQFLNELEGDVIAVVSGVIAAPNAPAVRVLIIERVQEDYARTPPGGEKLPEEIVVP
jgi:hypothetical protein